MKKLVVADFDGTLKPYKDAFVSQAVKDRIDALLEKGIYFAVSSGRTYGELAAFLPDYIDRIFFICNDGACYLKNGKPLYEKQIETEDLLRFFSCTEEGGCIFHGLDQNYSIGTVASAYAESFAPTPIKTVYQIKEKIFKVTTFGKTVTLPQGCGLRTHWDGGPDRSAQYVNRFVSKGRALSDLQIRLMLTSFDTVCIGDAGNDVAMMTGAKYSFCIGNRSPELSAACNKRAERIEDALDFCLNEF
ncbi:MAG: HAD-IIB family hydrolase [Clostridia bacterium]|nr:HAD-IIB family hydrolase [Clostridia bacterium]